MFRKEYVAEFLGTALLTMLGCGTAMMVGTASQLGCGHILVALAFGLGLMIALYLFGEISGGHFNPAVSIAMYKMRKLDPKELGPYILSQCLGAFVGVVLVSFFLSGVINVDLTRNFASNTLEGVRGSWLLGILAELVMTFIFVLVILKVTDKSFEPKYLSGILIGVTLAAIHIFGIPLTGVSVNPARSIVSALCAMMVYRNFVPMSQVFVFVVGPVLGALLACELYCYLYKPRKIVCNEVEKKIFETLEEARKEVE